MFESFFGTPFNSPKCKTLLRLAISRIKLLRNKRDVQLKQMKRELVKLLQSDQEPSARIRVEHIYREQNIMAAYEIIELFCELIAVRLPIIEAQRQCPMDLKEAVASIIFAAPRCADLPELLQIGNLLGFKYGKEFVAAAAQLHPDCGVNRLVIEKLSIRPPSGEVKLKLMKDIASELNVDWDPTTSESELLKAPEDLLEGSNIFMGATQLSLQSRYEEKQQYQPTTRGEPKDEKQSIPLVLPFVNQVLETNNVIESLRRVDPELREDSHHIQPHIFHNDDDDGKNINDEDKIETKIHTKDSLYDVVAAAEAAVKSAERAANAARAAALLANKHFDQSKEGFQYDFDEDDYASLSRDKAYESVMYTTDNEHHIKNEEPLFDENAKEKGSINVHKIFNENNSLNDDSNYSKRKHEHEQEGNIDTDSYRSNLFDRDIEPEVGFSSTHAHSEPPDYDSLSSLFQSFKTKR